MSKWDELTMAEKAEMMKVAVRNGITKLQDIRDKYNEFAEGGGIPDEEYYSTMEKVAEDNYQKWGLSNPDEALVHALNDNTYNYRGYYDKYPQSEANADTHWTDEFKTVYHPTFSVESSYSGQESQYNPQGLYGGHWIGDRFIPAPWQLSNTFKGGGYKPSDSVKKRISTWEGAAMTGAIDPLSGKWGKNRSFEAEADSFYNALPASIRSQVLSNPELADNLFSYSYNVGAGNFKKRVVPALEKYYTGNGSADEIAGSMWATGDKKLRGLRNRRAVERKGVVDALTPAFVQEPADNTFMPNPFAIQMENTYQKPIIVPNEGSYVAAHEVSPSEQRAQKVKESFDAINRFNALMNMLNMDTTAPTYTPDTGNPFLDAIGVLTNSNANGGKIHIAPSKRGTFTAAAKKHGKSVQAFASQVLAHPENYSPAMRKKANFARNAAKWHGLGGNLFDGTSQPSQKMQIGLDVQGWPNYTTEQLVSYGEENERRRKAIQDAYLNFATESNDATAVANGRPQNQHLVDKAIQGAKAHAAWEKEHPYTTIAGNLLGAVPLAMATSPLFTAAGEALAGTGITSTLAPGSSFWMNPVTQQIAKSTLGGITADAISTVATGKTIGGNVREMIGWQPSNEWTKLGYELLTDMANPGYMYGTKRPGFDIVPSPLIPSRGSAQMNHGRNFGTFRPETFNNWGSESLTHLTKDYAVKVPKKLKTPVDVGPKTFDDLGWRYRAAVNQKLSANKIAGFEPYEYIGYHTTEDGYVPVFRQKRLTLMGENTPEGKIFNEDALSDIEREMRTHSGLWKSWNIGDYGPAHNIGKNAEGVGRLFDANYAREPITWIMQNFPRKWEISPIGNARLFGNTLERSVNE